MRASLILVLLMGLCVAVLPATGADRADAAKIGQLIQQLGSTDFAEREKATRELGALGTAALEALRAAAKGDDLEIKRRAEDLLKKIEKQAETDQILAPTRLRLEYKDAAVATAVEDIRKKIGFPNIVLHDPDNKLADRKVSLGTGETTFWEAFDAFCQKAGLVELSPTEAPPGATSLPRLKPGVGGGNATPPAAPPKDGAPPAAQAPAAPAVQVPAVQVQVQVQAQPGAPPQPPPPPVRRGGMVNQITLLDGKPQNLPTCYVGALRIRALPPSTPIPGASSREGEALLALHVSPEPKLQLQNLVSVRVDKAIDDQEQSLTQMMAAANGGEDVPVVGVPRPPVAGFRVMNPNMLARVQVAPLRLKKGAKEAKTLKELSGTLTAQIRTAPETLLKVDNLLKAVGQTIKGDRGGSIKVLEATREEGGPLKLRLEMVTPAGVAPAAAASAPQQGNPVFTGGYNGLTLVDDKGQNLPLVPNQVQGRQMGDVVVYEYTFTSKPQQGSGEPAQLVFTGARTVTLDVAFHLKDVPLP